MRFRDQEVWCQRALGAHFEFIKKFSYSGKREISLAQFVVPPKRSNSKRLADNPSDYLSDGKEFFGIISTSNSFRGQSEWMVVQIYDCANFERIRNRIRDSEQVFLMTHIFVVPDSYMTEFVNEENHRISIRVLLEIVNVRNQQALPWNMVDTFREYFHTQSPSILTYIWRSRKLLLRSTEAWKQAIVLASAPNEIYLPIFNALEQMKYIGVDSIKKGFDKLRSSTLALVELVDNTAEKNGSSTPAGFTVGCSDDVSSVCDKVPFGFYRGSVPISKNTGKLSDFNKAFQKSAYQDDSYLGSRSSMRDALSISVRSNQPRESLDSIRGIEYGSLKSTTRILEKKSQTLAVEIKSYSQNTDVLLLPDTPVKHCHYPKKAVLQQRKKVEHSCLTQDTNNGTLTNSHFDGSVNNSQNGFYRSQSNNRKVSANVGGYVSSSTGFAAATDVAENGTTQDFTTSRNRFHKRTSYDRSDRNPLYETGFRQSQFTKRSPWINRTSHERQHQVHHHSQYSEVKEGHMRGRDSIVNTQPQKTSKVTAIARDSGKWVQRNAVTDLPPDPRDAAYESEIIYVNFSQYLRIRHQRQRNAPTMRDLRHLPRAAYFLSDDEDDESNYTSVEMVSTPTVERSPSIERVNVCKTHVSNVNKLLEGDRLLPVSVEKNLQAFGNLYGSLECLSLIGSQGTGTTCLTPLSDDVSPVAPSAQTLRDCSVTGSNVDLDVRSSECRVNPLDDHLLTPPRESASNFSISSVSSIEIPYSVSPSDPYSPLPFDETPMFLAGFHQKRIVYDIRSLSAVILSTLQQSVDNILIIWLSDIDVDVASSVALYPEQCIVCVKTLNFLANPDVMAILSSTGIIYKGLPFVDSGGVGFSLVWVLSFGTNRLFPDSEQFVQSHSELENLLIDHFAVKDKFCTNIIRSSCELHGLFAVLLKELKGSIIVTNRYTK